MEVSPFCDAENMLPRGRVYYGVMPSGHTARNDEPKQLLMTKDEFNLGLYSRFKPRVPEASSVPEPLELPPIQTPASVNEVPIFRRQTSRKKPAAAKEAQPAAIPEDGESPAEVPPPSEPRRSRPAMPKPTRGLPAAWSRSPEKRI